MNNHTCDALVVTCIDFRFQDYINNWISKNIPTKSYDRVALSGGVKNLETILGQLEISKKLHDIKKVILINHEDCGAYGQENFPDSQTEHQKHEQDLKNAASQIKEQYPDLDVQTHYIHLDGTFEPI